MQDIRGGCGWCCPSVKVEPERVFEILEVTGKQFDEVFRITNDGIYTKVREEPYTDPETGEPMIKYPCIFLDGNNRCTIYEQRPQVCRDYQCDECARLWGD